MKVSKKTGKGRGKGRGKARGRGRGNPIEQQLEQKGNEHNKKERNLHSAKNGEWDWSVPGLVQTSRCVNYDDIVQEMRIGDECDQNLVAILDELIGNSFYADNAVLEFQDPPADENCEGVKEIQNDEADVIEVIDTLINRAGPPVQSERSSDKSVQVIDVAGQVQPSDVKSDLSDIAVIDISTGRSIPGGAAALNTDGLECVGVVNVPQNQVVATNPVPNSQIITLDDTQLVLIVSNGHVQNDYFLTSQVNEGVKTGNVLNPGVQSGNISNPGIVNLGHQEAMVGDVTNMAPSHEGTVSLMKLDVVNTGLNSVMNPDVVNTDSNQRQENGRTNAQTVYTLKTVV